MKNIIGSALLFFLPQYLFPQQLTTWQITGQTFNPYVINTGVPFLLMTPDARANALGETGAATTSDVSSIFWNAAKSSFASNRTEISVGYTPWLRSLLPDINFGYTDGYYKMNDREALSYSLRNIDYNTMSFTNIVGNAADEFHPRETAVDLAYGRKLASNFSMALAFRYIYSDLTNGKTVNGRSSHPGQSMAIDISAYYKKDFNIAGREFARAFGLNVSNIGSKISYYDLQSKLFLPTSLRLGGRLSVAIGEKNFFSVTTDLNKLLIPEPHIYSTLPAGTYGNTDFREELKQTTIGTGIEFVFNHCFFLRSGYFYEDARYGGRQYFTAGIGVRYKRFALDLSDLLPTGIRSPLKNTARFSFTCSLPVITKEYIDHQQ